jgi:hypothetical protein
MTTRVLPADVYDTLELSALAYGGIGGGRFHDKRGAPYCVRGHAAAAASSSDKDWYPRGGPVNEALTDAGLGLAPNDRAVHSLNARRDGAWLNRRVRFEDWCKELNVVRGAS